MHDAPVYIVYDRATGALIGTHASRGPDGELLPMTREEILAGLDSLPVEAASGDVDVLEVAFDELDPSRTMRVDLAAKALVAGWRLRLTAERTELEGDGEDTVELEVAAIGEDDEVDPTFSGEVRVETTRGRLSARGGRVALDQGIARLVITSVPETVARVLVSATDPTGLAAPATLTLEFL